MSGMLKNSVVGNVSNTLHDQTFLPVPAKILDRCQKCDRESECFVGSSFGNKVQDCGCLNHKMADAEREETSSFEILYECRDIVSPRVEARRRYCVTLIARSGSGDVINNR